MNGHFMGFHQLVQKLEQITPIISTLQDKQNEWPFYGFSTTGSKSRTNESTLLRSMLFTTNQWSEYLWVLQNLERITSIISTLHNKANEWSFDGFSTTEPKFRTNDTNHPPFQNKHRDGSRKLKGRDHNSGKKGLENGIWTFISVFFS